MAEPETPHSRTPAPGPLPIRTLHEVWRRAAVARDFVEVDALARAEETPASGQAVDLPARATRRIAAAANGLDRVFAIRTWSDDAKSQRGRSPEFWLLSARIFAEPSVGADADTIACAVEVLRLLGLTPQHAKVRISHRDAVRSLLLRRGVHADHLDAWFPLLHRAGKMSNDDFVSAAVELGMEPRTAVDVLRVLAMSTPFEEPTTQLFLSEQAGGRGPEYFKSLFAELRDRDIADWCVLNLGIVRAGAHHSGLVFEIHPASGRGRSIAGGGRSTFPDLPVPDTVGFDMGDTPILRLLEDLHLPLRTPPAPQA